MTPPRMPGRDPDERVDMTPTYAPDPGDGPDDIVDLTPEDSPDRESDETMDMMTPPDAPEGDDFEDFMDMVPSYSPERDAPYENSATTAPYMPNRKPMDRRAAPPQHTPRPTDPGVEGEHPKGPKAGGNRRKYILAGLVGIVALLFASNRVLGYSLHLGPINLAGANTRTSQPTPIPLASTPTPLPVTLGNNQAVGPLILLNPGVVRQGTQVTVTGSGFDPGAVIDLSVIRQGSATPLTSTFVQASKGGTFTGATLNVPTSLGSGNFLVVANERNSKHTAQAVGEVAGGAPTVKLGEQVGQPGDMIVLALHGFAPEETVNVYWNAMSGQPLTTFQADGGGGIGQGKLQVPIGAAGENTFLFVGAKSQSVVAANFLVLQLYPTVKPSSYALRADNLLSFSGSGFGPGERVFIFLNSTNNQPLGVVAADGHGAFKNAAGFVVPFQLKGKQTIIFMGEQSHATDAITFTIEPYAPVVQPSTYGGFPGTTITFFVAGFARNEVVHVYAGHTKSAMGNMVGCFQTNDHGTAAAVGSYLIPGSAQGQLGFALVGEKSGGVGVATINISAPPAPVQTPSQPPFTCPLDQPGQQTQQPVAPQQQQPDQNQQQQQQQQQQNQQPDQNQQNQQQQQPAGPQGNVARPGRQLALGFATYGLVYIPAAFDTATALNPSLSAPRRVAAQRSVATMARNRAAFDARRQAWIEGSMSGQPPLSPALVGLGVFWLVLVAALTVTIIRRSTRQGTSLHDLDKDGDHDQKNIPSAALVTARGACHETSEEDRTPAPQTATHLSTETDDATSRLPAPADKYQPDGAAWLMSAPSGYEGVGPTAHAAWQTATQRGEGCHGCHDTTLVRTYLTQASAEQGPFALFLVADGTGHSHAADRASRFAVESIARHVMKAMSSGVRVPANLIMPMFKHAVMLADDALLAQNAAKQTEMTTTVTGAMLVGRRVYVVNVGDSRTYVCSPKGGLWQLTKDHSVVFGLVSAGFLYPEALDTFSPVRRLYRSLGDAEHPIHVDTFEMPVSPGDWLLLCSDGLWRHVRDPQIETTLRTTADPLTATQMLIRQATQGKCEDDVTAVVVRIPANPAP